MATMSVGTSTKNKIHAYHSDMAAAKETKTTLCQRALVNINAKHQAYKKVIK